MLTCVGGSTFSNAAVLVQAGIAFCAFACTGDAHRHPFKGLTGAVLTDHTTLHAVTIMAAFLRGTSTDPDGFICMEAGVALFAVGGTGQTIRDPA